VKVEVGDLVNFYAGAWILGEANRYANPGIVISCSDPINGRVVAKIYWRDGKITREHSSYLNHFPDLEVIDESR
jgi:hypothetical protein